MGRSMLHISRGEQRWRGMGGGDVFCTVEKELREYL
jgi:hypothetical protein